MKRVCLLGFGEVGTTLAQDLAARTECELIAWDLLFVDPHSKPSQELPNHPRVQRAASAAQAAQGCDAVISAVTAGQALDAARSLLRGLGSGAWFVDLNSVSPATKTALAHEVNAAGARFVEAAVMAPIAPKRIDSPILAGGPHARAFIEAGRALGFGGLAFCAAEYGRAAATKMCRSVIVKGVEALLSEALLSARHYGVEQEVIASLSDLFPRPDWNTHARYMISRTLLHGTRRAEEMREAARTVTEAGLAPWMSEATVARQAWAPRHAAALAEAQLEPMLDAMLTTINGARPHLSELNGDAPHLSRTAPIASEEQGR